MTEQPPHHDHAPDSSLTLGEKSRAKPRSVVKELLSFLYHYSLWWILPILVILALMVVVALMVGPVSKPFIYRQ